MCVEGIWDRCAGKGRVQRVGGRNPSAQSVDEVKEMVPAEAWALGSPGPRALGNIPEACPHSAPFFVPC